MVTAPIHPRIHLLAARAESHAASLSTTLNALVELEKFVSIGRTTEDEDMTQLRTSLGRLMRWNFNLDITWPPHKAVDPNLLSMLTGR